MVPSDIFNYIRAHLTTHSHCSSRSGAIWHPYCGWRCCGDPLTNSISNCTWNILRSHSLKKGIRSSWKLSSIVYPLWQRPLSKSVPRDAAMHIPLRSGHSWQEVPRKFCVWSMPNQMAFQLLFFRGMSHKKRLGHMVLLLVQLRNYGQQNESSAWTMDTSNTREMVMVYLPKLWSPPNWGRICIPLSAITVHTLHMLKVGVHPHMERAA